MCLHVRAAKLLVPFLRAYIKFLSLDTWHFLCVTIWALAGAANAPPAQWPTANPAGSVALTRSRSVKVKLATLINHHILHVTGTKLSSSTLLPILGCSVNILSFLIIEKLQVLLAWGTSAWTVYPASSPSLFQRSQLARAWWEDLDENFVMKAIKGLVVCRVYL